MALCLVSYFQLSERLRIIRWRFLPLFQFFCVTLQTEKQCSGLPLVSYGTRGKSGQHRTPHFRK